MHRQTKIEIDFTPTLPISVEEMLERFDWFEAIRMSNPTFYNEETHCWEFFLYEDMYKDVNRIIIDYLAFSDEEIPSFPQDSLREETVVRKDPPIQRQHPGPVKKRSGSVVGKPKSRWMMALRDLLDARRRSPN